MISYYFFLAGIALGAVIGYAHGLDSAAAHRIVRSNYTKLRAWRRARRLGLSSSGSLGNVRREGIREDGRAGSAADGHTPNENQPRSVDGEAHAPNFSKRQRIPLSVVRDEAP